MIQVAVAYAEKYGDRYIDASSEMPMANEDTITASAERLLLASIPVQDMLVAVRHIYRWDDRMQTSIYATIYFAIWAADFIGGFSVKFNCLSQRLDFLTPMIGACGLVGCPGPILPSSNN